VHEDLLELVHRADVVEVPVRGERDDRPLEQVGQLLPHAPEPESALDEQVALAPSHQPEVPADRRVGVRLPQQEHALLDITVLEPPLGGMPVA
jgi:hypothetical protein